MTVDARVRERAPQELQVEHPGERDVVEVVAPAADEAPVLEHLTERPTPRISSVAAI